ncbi:unnamed protein product [Amaranthus hypochondriacus]
MKPLKNFLHFTCFSSPKTSAQPPQPNTDTNININNKIEVKSRGIKPKLAIRKPKKPPIGSGRGGQIH